MLNFERVPTIRHKYSPADIVREVDFYAKAPPGATPPTVHVCWSPLADARVSYTIPTHLYAPPPWVLRANLKRLHGTTGAAQLIRTSRTWLDRTRDAMQRSGLASQDLWNLIYNAATGALTYTPACHGFCVVSRAWLYPPPENDDLPIVWFVRPGQHDGMTCAELDVAGTYLSEWLDYDNAMCSRPFVFRHPDAQGIDARILGLVAGLFFRAIATREETEEASRVRNNTRWIELGNEYLHALAKKARR